MNRKWFFPFPIEVTQLIFYIVLGQIFDVLNFARIGNGFFHFILSGFSVHKANVYIC